MAQAAQFETVLTVEIDREEDGRWIAEVPQLPGVLVYGKTREEAFKNVKALALRVIADHIDDEQHARATSLRFDVA